MGKKHNKSHVKIVKLEDLQMLRRCCWFLQNQTWPCWAVCPALKWFMFPTHCRLSFPCIFVDSTLHPRNRNRKTRRAETRDSRVMRNTCRIVFIEMWKHLSVFALRCLFSVLMESVSSLSVDLNIQATTRRPLHWSYRFNTIGIVRLRNEMEHDEMSWKIMTVHWECYN